MRVLDEVAEAIRRAGGRSPRPLLKEFGLREQFEHPITPKQWIAIQQYLACPLPLLEFVEGFGFRPIGFATIWDLVDHATRWHPEWEPSTDRTEAAWREAQIFAGVRIVLVEALNVEPKAVTRQARIKADLGADT
jgi:hypothetical protein